MGAVLPWNVSRLRGTKQYITHVDEQAGIRTTDEIAVARDIGTQEIYALTMKWP
jgi:hypothetical protein